MLPALITAQFPMLVALLRALHNVKRATPKAKVRKRMFAYYSRTEKFARFFIIAKLLKLMVARDGIEPPTPAFSGPLTESPK
jgi:hypothetical protein